MNSRFAFLSAVVLCVSAAVSAMAGTDYFVDANNGVDADAEGRGRSAEMPYLTITYALGKAKTSGDRVYVAEGTYLERNLTVSAGVGLIASGRRDYTTIDANASSEDNARCIANLAAKAYVKGFTIQNGWGPASPETNGGGIKADANAAIIDCAIRHCQGHRGGAGNGGIWIRCYFSNDNVSSWAPAANGVYGPSFVANCVFDGAGCVCDAADKKVVNCTFRLNGANAYVGTNDGSRWPLVYNSIVENIQGAAAFYNSVAYLYNGTESQIKDKDDACLFNPAVTRTSPSIALNANFAPLSTATQLVGCGNRTYYEESFPEAWREIGEWTKGYGGGARLAADGSMDIGAGEYQWQLDSLLGYETTVEEVGDDQVKFTFRRNDKSPQPLVTLTFGDESVNFDEEDAGYAFVVTVAGRASQTFPAPVVTYDDQARTLYVDPKNGDDGRKGYRPEFAFKTVTAALAAAQAAVKATSQSYCVSLPEGTYAGNITVPASVGLVASGSRENTVIDGNNETCGVILNGARAYVKGFTIRNCTTTGSGAGVSIKSDNAAAIACAFYKCHAEYRGGAGYGGIYIGCYFNSDCESKDGNATANALWSPIAIVNCVFNGEGSFGYGTLILNSTYLFPSTKSTSNNPGANIYNSLLVHGQSVGSARSTVFYASSISKASGYTDDGKVTFAATTTNAGLNNDDYSPIDAAVLLLGKADPQYYEENFPADWTAFKDVDFNGKPRLHPDGTMDIGACQSDLLVTVYVDATNGDDEENDGTQAKPFKSLNVALAKVAAGGTVHCAAGDYATNDYATNLAEDAQGARNVALMTRPNVKLVADEGPDMTFITGQKGTDGVGGVRCVGITAAGCSVRGFTIRQGGPADNAKGDNYCNYGCGIYGQNGAPATAVNCRFTDIASTMGRGSASFNVSLFSCTIASDVGNDRNLGVTQNGNYYNSTFFRQTYSWGEKIVNCTYVNCAPRSNFTYGGKEGPLLIYNTLVKGSISNSNNLELLASRVTGTVPSDCFVDEDCSVNEGTAGVDIDPATGKLLASATAAIDQGNDDYYEQIPEAYRDNLDGFGRARFVNGGVALKIDLGAYEFSWADAEKTGLKLTVADVGGGQNKLTVSRLFDSDKLCTGFTYDGTAVDFGAEGTAWEWSVTVAGDPLIRPLVPVYAATQTDWYVNPTGDDNNKGYHAQCPRKTLVKAMELAKSGDTVHAAEGTYGDGSITYGGVNCRVVVTGGVTLTADGARDRTIIVGHKSDDLCGTGETAMRGATVTGGSVLKGFWIKDCAAPLSLGQHTGGGGISCASDSAVVGCKVTDCVASRGGAVIGGTYIGCYFDDSNRAFDSLTPTEEMLKPHSTFNAVYDAQGYYNCVFDDCCVVFSYGVMLNCTQLGGENLQCRSRMTADKFTVVNSKICFAEVGQYYNTLAQKANSMEQIVTDDRSRFDVPSVRLQVDGDMRPRRFTNSYLADAGDKALYDQYFPAQWAAYKDFDYAGGVRTADGRIDVGAGQHTWEKAGMILLLK